MSIMNLTGWNSIGVEHGMTVPVLSGLNSDQDVTFALTVRNTVALGTGDRWVRVAVDAASYINFGDVTVTAAPGNTMLAAGEAIILDRTKDDFTHVAAVDKA